MSSDQSNKGCTILNYDASVQAVLAIFISTNYGNRELIRLTIGEAYLSLVIASRITGIQTLVLWDQKQPLCYYHTVHVVKFLIFIKFSSNEKMVLPNL